MDVPEDRSLNRGLARRYRQKKEDGGALGLAKSRRSPECSAVPFTSPSFQDQEQQQSVLPGPCDPETGCPPPTEIAWLRVDQVVESASREVENTEMMDLLAAEPPAVPPITEIMPVAADLVPGSLTCILLPEGRVQGGFSYTYTVFFADAVGYHVLTSSPIAASPAEFTVRMTRAGEPGLTISCDAFLTFLDVICNGTTVTARIRKRVVFYLLNTVQLLVPSYGRYPENRCEK